MKTDAKNRLARLEKHLSTLAGLPIEITIRGFEKFTFSFDGENQKAAETIKDFFLNATKKIEVDYDALCDQTCIYIEAR